MFLDWCKKEKAIQFKISKKKEEVAVNRTVYFYQDQQQLSVVKRQAIVSNTKGSSKEKARAGKGTHGLPILKHLLDD